MNRDNQQERLSFQIGYLLGIIDGEGHLGLRSQRQRGGTLQISPVLQIVNCEKELIDLVAGYMKELGLPVYIVYRKSNKLHHRDTYAILLKGMKRLSKVLEVIMKYPFVKYKRAKVLKEYIDYRLSRPKKEKYTEKEMEFFKRMTILNTVGR